MTATLLLPDRYSDVQVRAAAVEEVDPDAGTILLRAAPYGEETRLARGLFEVFEPGAFARAANAPHRAKLWNGHGGPLIGHAVEIDDRADASWIKARFSNTLAGQEARELAADGTLDACSVEFVPMPDHMKVTRDADGAVHVRHARARLLGVALVPHPAYEGAAVVSVRDERAQLREEALARLRALTA